MQWLIIVLVSVAAAYLLRRPSARATLILLVKQGARRLRVQLGSYELADIVADMVDLAEGSSIPSVTRSYLPTQFTFSISAADAEIWAGLLAVLPREVGELIMRRAVELRLTLDRIPLVELVVSDQLRPGRVKLEHCSLASPVASINDEAETVAFSAKTAR